MRCIFLECLCCVWAACLCVGELDNYRLSPRTFVNNWAICLYFSQLKKRFSFSKYCRILVWLIAIQQTYVYCFVLLDCLIHSSLLFMYLCLHFSEFQCLCFDGASQGVCPLIIIFFLNEKVKTKWQIPCLLKCDQFSYCSSSCLNNSLTHYRHGLCCVM